MRGKGGSVLSVKANDGFDGVGVRLFKRDLMLFFLLRGYLWWMMPVEG